MVDNSIFRVTKLILATHAMTMDFALIHFSTAKMFQLMKRKLYRNVRIRTKISSHLFETFLSKLRKWNFNFRKMECPVWARRGCFKTVSEHYEDNYKRVTETIRLVF